MTAAEPTMRRFRPGALLTACTAGALLVLITLGTWQVRRLHWKNELIAMAEARAAAAPVAIEALLGEPAAADFRAASAEGTYRHDLAFAMGTVAQGGQVGARLVTPLVLADGSLLLVERGWLPAELLPPATPPALQPEGPRTVTGRVRDHGADRAGPFTPANEPERRRWYGYDLPALAAALGGEVRPLVLTLDRSDSGAELPRPLPLAVQLPNKHLGYAITWYGLAAGLLAVYVAYGFRRSSV